MSSLEERINAFAEACANLLVQLNELAELHEQIRIKQIALAVREPLKQRPATVSRRVLGSRAYRR
jgi:hypothetical protein